MILAAVLAASAPSGLTPAYLAWTKCIQEGAKSMRHAPDAADVVARAVLAICEDLERAAKADPANPLTDEQWAENRDRLERTALATVVLERSQDRMQGAK